MIVDTSVWIAYLSTSESLASRWLADRIAADSTVIVPEVVMMELLIGKTDEDTAALRRRLLQRFAIEPLAPVRDAEDAAAIHRRCRRGGDTVRSLIDCQVAAMALRIGVAVAHRDRDYEAIRTLRTTHRAVVLTADTRTISCLTSDPWPSSSAAGYIDIVDQGTSPAHE